MTADRVAAHDVAAQFAADYARQFDFWQSLSSHVAATCREALDAELIDAIVTSRAKDLQSLRTKVHQRALDKQYMNEADVLLDIPDLAGVRIALYRSQDVDRVRLLLRRHLRVVEEVCIDKNEGYRANHFRTLLAPEDILSLGERFNGARVEVQVATLMMHTWSEVEHDLLYKKLDGEPSQDEKDLLKRLNGVAREGDHLIEKLAEAKERRIRGDKHTFVSPSELYDQLRTAQLWGPEPPQWLWSFSEDVFRHLQGCGRANKVDVEEAFTGASRDIDEQDLAVLLFAGSMARYGWQDDEQAKQRVIPRGPTWWRNAEGEWVSIYDDLVELRRRYEHHVASNPSDRDPFLNRNFAEFRRAHLTDSINGQVSYEYQDRIRLLEHQARRVLGDVR